MSKYKTSAALVSSLAFASIFAPNAFAENVILESCEGIENCAVVTSTAELDAAFNSNKSTIILGSSFELTDDLVLRSDAMLYLNNYIISSVSSSCWGLNIWANLEINAGANGKIYYSCNGYSPLYVGYADNNKVGSVTMKGGTIEADSSKTKARTVNVQAGSSFTLDGGTINGYDTVEVSGSFAMRDGAINGDDVAVAVFKDASFVMDGGTITSGRLGVSGNGSTSGVNEGTNATITINDGTINADNTGVYAPQVNGVTTIKGGTITGGSGVEVRAGTLNIEGGTITSDASSFSTTSSANGPTTLGAAVAVAQHNTKQPINVTITGGTFSGVKALNETNTEGNSEEDLAKISISVEDGDFTGEISSEDVDGFITGGTFSEEPVATMILPGHEAEEYSDGTWGVVPVMINWKEDWMEDCEDDHICGWIYFLSDFIADRRADVNMVVTDDSNLKLDSAKEAGELFGAMDLKILDRNGDDVTVENTNIEVTIELDEDTYNELKSYDKLYAVFFDDNGNEAERIEAKVEKETDGGMSWYYLTFNITHMSTYGIIGVNNAAAPETGVITRESGSATVASLFTAIFVGITTSVLSFTYLMSRRNRR